MIHRIFRKNKRSHEEMTTEYIDGVIAPEAARALEQRLEETPELATEIAELQQVRQLLRSQPMVEPPRSFALPYAPRPYATPPRPNAGLRWLQGATAAAAVLLVGLVGANLVIAPGASQLPAAETQNVAGMAAPNDTAGVERSFATKQAPPDASSAPVESGTIETTFDATSIADPSAEAGLPTFDDNLDSGRAHDRTLLEWAQLAASLLTGVLALLVVASTWRSRVPRSPQAD